MKRIAAVTALIPVLIIGCQQQTFETTPSTQTWFEGTIHEALSQAQERNTLVMLDFYSHT